MDIPSDKLGWRMLMNINELNVWGLNWNTWGVSVIKVKTENQIISKTHQQKQERENHSRSTKGRINYHLQ